MAMPSFYEYKLNNRRIQCFRLRRKVVPAEREQRTNLAAETNWRGPAGMGRGPDSKALLQRAGLV
jgi:hypothetical protein